MNNITTTRECYDLVLKLFNEHEVEFVIIRGFRFLPDRMDTDIDLVIHPNSYNKFLEVCKILKENKIVNNSRPKGYIYNNKKFYYDPLVTQKHFTGRYYRFDTYSDLFFYENGEGRGNNALVVNNLFKYYLFKNKVKKDNYFIPHPIHDVILLLYRNIYDKQCIWKKKHTDRIKLLMRDINTDEFNFYCNMCFTESQNVLENIKKNNFKDIVCADQKINNFIIRKKGIQKEIVDNIISKIKNEGYKILDTILVTIGDTNKFYKNFYDNFEDYEKEILKLNTNMCLLIITNSINTSSSILKVKIRKDYSHKFSDCLGCPGNIIHSSDNFDECNNELELIFKENITNFKSIGTYYSHHE